MNKYLLFISLSLIVHTLFADLQANQVNANLYEFSTERAQYAFFIDEYDDKAGREILEIPARKILAYAEEFNRVQQQLHKNPTPYRAQSIEFKQASIRNKKVWICLVHQKAMTPPTSDYFDSLKTLLWYKNGFNTAMIKKKEGWKDPR